MLDLLRRIYATLHRWLLLPALMVAAYYIHAYLMVGQSQEVVSLTDHKIAMVVLALVIGQIAHLVTRVPLPPTADDSRVIANGYRSAIFALACVVGLCLGV